MNPGVKDAGRGRRRRSSSWRRAHTALLLLTIALTTSAACQGSATTVDTDQPTATDPSPSNQTATTTPSGSAKGAAPSATLPPHPDHDPSFFEAEVSPTSGPPGTAITVTASGCPRAGPAEVEFRDRRVVDAGANAPGKLLPTEWSGTTLTATYAIAPNDAKGSAVIRVRCSDKWGRASFVVL